MGTSTLSIATDKRFRFPLMALGMAALLAGMWAGLLRLGWNLPLERPFPADHGPLMVCGFLGTLIGLERAVALGRPWAFAGPLLSAAGALALIAGAPEWIAPLLMSGASAILIAIFAVITFEHPALFTVTMALGAVSWLGGNIVWLEGQPIFYAVSWWAAFLVLTIAGERLELSRLVPISRTARLAFAATVAVLLASLALGGVAFPIGSRLAGVALLALTVWLLRHDVARRTVRQTGLPRFSAICLLSGYAWLGAGAVLMLVLGPVTGGTGYDAVLHAIFVGFVFAMVFGHAPIIFPAVLGMAVPFRRAFYAHLALLHLSLLLRLIGDLTGAVALRSWGGLFNAVAILLFLANTTRSVQLGRRVSEKAFTDARSTSQVEPSR